MKYEYNKARFVWSLVGVSFLGMYGVSKYYVRHAQARPHKTYVCRKCSYNMIILDGRKFNKPDLDHTPIHIKNKQMIFLDTDDISRDLIIENHTDTCELIITSLLKRSTMHVIQSLTAPDIRLSVLFGAFLKSRTDKPQLYVIKDVYALHHSKDTHLVSVIIEQDGDYGVVLAQTPDGKRAYKALWNFHQTQFTDLKSISPEDKEQKQKMLLRKYLGLRKY
jgi:hypothetical protein